MKLRRIGMTTALCGGLIFGQHAPADASFHHGDKSYVQAMGHAQIRVKPDRAMIEIGVMTQGTTALAAADQNATRTAAVLAELKAQLRDAGTIRTTNYSVRPNYQTPKPGTQPSITGYTATNTVEVTLDDLTQISKLVDVATQSGSNTIGGLEFKLKDRNPIRARALREAAIQAKASADAMAAALGLRTVRVLSVEESSEPSQVYGLQRASVAFGAGMASTPIEAGDIEVSGSVVLRVEVAQ